MAHTMLREAGSQIDGRELLNCGKIHMPEFRRSKVVFGGIKPVDTGSSFPRAGNTDCNRIQPRIMPFRYGTSLGAVKHYRI
jgi:hypothetical protein